MCICKEEGGREVGEVDDEEAGSMMRVAGVERERRGSRRESV